MSVELQLDGITYDYPTENESPGWGEPATSWAEKVTELLNTLSPLGSISLTTSLISASATDQPVLGFAFSSSIVVAFKAVYYISMPDEPSVEFGTVNGVYNGTAWEFSVDPTGSADVYLEVDSSGQVTYTNNNATNGIIKFKTESVISA